MDADLKRREFLKTGATLLAGAALANLADLHLVAAATTKSSLPSAAKIGWLVGVASYTFRRFSLYEALDMIAALVIEYEKDSPELQADVAKCVAFIERTAQTIHE